jgi:hypothetical protein
MCPLLPAMAWESELTAADLLYLFCTCTAAFYRFSPIEPIDFAKSFENSTHRGRPTPAAATNFLQ